MELYHKRLLTKCMPMFQEELDTADVIDFLINKRVLTEQDQKIIEGEKVPGSRVHLLLNILKDRGDRSFDFFLQAMEEAEEAEYDEIVKELKCEAKNLKEEFEKHLFELVTVIGESYGNFIFWNFLYDLTELLVKNEAVDLCKRLHFDENTRKSVRKSSFPGLALMSACLEQNFLALKDCSKLCNVILEMELKTLGPLAEEYKKVISYPAFRLNLEGFPTEDNSLKALKKGRTLSQYLLTQYGVKLDTFRPDVNTLFVRIPNLETLNKLCSDIKSSKLTISYQASDAAANVRITFEEVEFGNIEKHFAEKANCFVSIANVEEKAETTCAHVSEESGSDSEESEEDTEGYQGKEHDSNESTNIPAFGLLMERVSQAMNLGHCKRVATMLCWSTADLDRIDNGTDLLRMMKERGDVSEHRVSYLRYLLNEIKLQEAVEKIAKYEEIYCYGRRTHPSPETGNVNKLASSNDSSQMSALHRKVLNSIMFKLKKKGILKAAVKFMLDNYAFTKAEREEMNAHGKKSERTKKFVTILKAQSFEAYQLFYDFLERNYPSIAENVKTNEVRLARSSPYWKIMMSTKLRRLKKRATFSIQEDSIEGCASNSMDISIVLVGKTGSGKSSTGNTILGRSKAFTTSTNLLKSCTKTNHLERVYIGQLVLHVMDTPGLFDTEGKLMDNQSVLLEIAKAVIDFPDGIDVFVIVSRIDAPFTKEDCESIDKIEERFGSEIFQHAILVLTRGSQMESDTLSEHLSPDNIPPYLVKLIKKLSGRVIVVENKPKQDYFKELQHHWVIAAICSFVKQKAGSAKYTNEQFEAVQEMIKENAKQIKDHTCAINLTTTFLHDFIKKTDEAELQKLKEGKKFDKVEMNCLEDIMRKADLWNKYICPNIQSIVKNVIIQNNLVIDQKLSSLKAERQTKGQLSFQRHWMSLEKMFLELQRKQIMETNAFLDDKINDYIWNSYGDKLAGLLNSNDIPVDIRDDFKEKRLKFISPKLFSDLSKATLASKRDMINMRMQSLMKQEETFTTELHSLMGRLSLRELNFAKQNNDLNQKQYLLLQEKLQNNNYDFTIADLKKMAPRVIRENIEEFINIKESQIHEQKLQRRKENLLRAENIINNHLFDLIEEASEEELKSFQNALYPTENDIAELMGMIQLEEVYENDIRDIVTTFLRNYESAIQTKYSDKLKSKQELEKRIREQIEHQKKKNRAKEEVIHFAENDAKDFLRKLRKRQLKEIKEKLEKNELPTELVKAIKDKLSPENMLNDEELSEVAMSVINSKKEMIMKLISDSGNCFPSKSFVTKERSGKVPISLIKVGDRVLSLNSESSLEFEEIFFVAHSDKHVDVMYLRIETARQKTLFVSPNHCLPVGPLKVMKAAKEININDIVYTAEGKNLISDTVTSVRYELHQGAYCPYTLSGTIVVDNIVASCFTTTFAPNLAHTVLAPIRLIYKYTPLSIYTSLLSPRNMQFISLITRKGIMYRKKTKGKNKNVCF